MYINFLIIAAIGIIIGLLLALGYFSQTMGRYYGSHTKRRGNEGIMFVLAFIVLTGFAFMMFGNLQSNRSNTSYTVPFEERQVEPKADHQYQKQEAPPTYDNMRKNIQQVKHEHQQPVHYASIIGQGLLEQELDRVKSSREAVQITSSDQKHYRVQLIAGSNERGALSAAQQQQSKFRISTYVLLDHNSPSQAYKVMVGDFDSRKDAKHFIQNHNISGITKDMSASTYEEIARF